MSGVCTSHASRYYSTYEGITDTTVHTAWATIQTSAGGYYTCDTNCVYLLLGDVNNVGPLRGNVTSVHPLPGNVNSVHALPGNPNSVYTCPARKC